MKTKYLFIIAAIGIAVGIVTVIITNVKFKAPPPVAVSYNPYDAGIYSTGIIETYQLNGSNINIFPEVAARVTDIMVTNGQEVKKGMPLIALDDSVQAGIVEKDLAEIGYARASLVNVQQQLEKMQKAYSINPKSVRLLRVSMILMLHYWKNTFLPHLLMVLYLELFLQLVIMLIK